MRLARRRRKTERITLNLASMIDVTFLLLIYFMVTTVLARPEDKLSPTLQTEREGQAGQTQDFQPQILDVLRLEGGPRYRLGERVLEDRAALREAMAALPVDPGVFIKVHDGVTVEFAMTALQVARDVGFEQVTYVPVE